MTLLDIAQINEIMNAGRTLLGVFFAIGASIWTLNKLYLQGKYQTKTESAQAFEKLQLEIHTHSVKTSHEIHLQNEKLNRMEKDSEVFKAKYTGDMDLLKEQMKNQSNVLADISHKVNNLASLKIPSIIEMMIEEKFEKLK